MLKSIYSDLGHYNLWANRRLIDNFRLHPEPLLDQPVQSSFTSARKTLLHVWDAEQIWLKRLQGVSPDTFPSRSFEGSGADLYQGLLDTSAEFAAFLDEQEEAFFAVGQCRYATTAGSSFDQFNREIIQHIINHSSYHRGQLVTISRALGLTSIPQLDYILYLREKKN